MQETAPYKAATVQPFTSHLTNHPSKMSKTCFTLISDILQHMDTPVLADWQKLTFISSVWALSAI